MQSKNLLIRPSSFDDCSQFAAWEKTESIKEFFSIDESRDYEEVVREFILRETDPSMMQFTICLGESGQPVGRIYISKIDRHSDALDITRIYLGDPDMRGKGYGEEAMRLLLDYCFMDLHMERVTLDHFTGNKPAASLYQKLGFQYEGVARNAAKKNGKYYDLNLMSMLRVEYYGKLRKED